MSLFNRRKSNKNVTKDDLKILQRIKQLRLQILIHSCIYYKFNCNIWTDDMFDKQANELIKLQSKYPNHSEKVKWHQDFKDYDFPSGFNLPYSHPWVVNKASYILKSHNLRGRNGK